MTQMSSDTILDHHAREKALNVHQSFIVQAPAGSGKTELLTQRFLALLPTVNDPEAILAITFTRKAANEMLRRITQALQDAMQPMPEALHLQRRWHLARAALNHAEKKNWQLLDTPSRLRIQTLDSLTSYLTANMPIQSKLGIHQSITDSPDHFYQEAACRFLTHGLQHPSWQAHIETLLLHLDNRLDKTKQLLASMLGKRESWLPYLYHYHQKDDLRQSLETALTHIAEDCLQDLDTHLAKSIRQDLYPLMQYALTHLDQRDTLHELQIAHLPEIGISCDLKFLSLWQTLIPYLLTQTGTLRKSVTVKQGFPAPSSFTDNSQKAEADMMKKKMKALLAEIDSQEDTLSAMKNILLCPATTYTESSWQVIAALLTCLPALAAELHVLFAEHGVCDFSQINIQARYALGSFDDPSELALRLDTQLQHILVDEFQDTSTAQFDLLTALTRGWQANEGRSLFLVGDPMQSIYRFRNAQVGLFLRAQTQGIGDIALDTLVLSSNFRSQANLVHWFNDSFSQLFPKENDMSQGKITYTPAHAVCEAIDNAVFYHACDKQHMTEAMQVVDIIQSTQASNPQQRIAILVRARTHLAEILPALRQAGIDYIATDIDSLADLTCIQDCLTLTKALLNPYDRIAWCALLRTPWCGLRLADICILADSKHHHALFSRLKDYISLAVSEDAKPRCQQLVSVFTHFFQERGRQSFAEAVEGVWFALGGAALLQDEREAELIQCYFSLLSQACVAASLPDLDSFEKQLKTSAAPTISDPSIGVEIMTIHKSKGLEFDVVLLPGLEKTGKADDPQLLLWAERTRAKQTDLIIAPIRASEAAYDATYRYLQQQENMKTDMEALRLFYVAATRAKVQCHLFATLDCQVDRETDKSLVAPAKSILAKLMTHFRAGFTALRERPQITTQKITDSHMPSVIKRITHTSLSQLSADHFQLSAYSAYKNTSNPFIEKNHAAPIIGTIIHAWLYQISLDGLDKWDIQTIQALSPIIHIQLKESGLARQPDSAAHDTILKALMNITQCPKARWILSHEHDDPQSEYALTFVDAQTNTLEKIIIDRTFIANGIRWIIDYKVPLYDLTPTDVRLQAEKYQPQLARYAKIMQKKDGMPVKIALYFPLQGLWWETSLETEGLT